MMKLLGRANSSNVMKVIWVLEELGLPYERIDRGGAFGGTDTPAYRAMNPLGLVPSLQDDEVTLFESNAITRYVCNAHAAGTSWYPTAPGARGTVEAWQDFQQTALNRPMSAVFLGLVRTAPADRDMAAIGAAAREVDAIWTILDARLAKQPWLAGDQPTLADVAYGPHIHRWLTLPVPNRSDAPNLTAWYQRMLARPAYRTNVAIPIT